MRLLASLAALVLVVACLPRTASTPSGATATPSFEALRAAVAPQATIFVGVAKAPTVEIDAALVAGTGSWFAYRPGESAAGPALRALIGPGWRGAVVKVCHKEGCIRTRLTDWCQCFKGTADERLIDLSDDDFAALAPLSRGLIRVQVTLP